jgi:hypothetical protein
VDNCRQAGYPAFLPNPILSQAGGAKNFLSFLFDNYRQTKRRIRMRSFSQIQRLLHHNSTLQALAKCRIFTWLLPSSRFKSHFSQRHPKKKPFLCSGKPFAESSWSSDPKQGADNVELTGSKSVLR